MNKIPIKGVRETFEGIMISHSTKLYVNSLVRVSGNGLTPKRPFKTIQEAVNTANTAANKGKSFDIIVASGYYQEKINFSDVQNAVWSETVSLFRTIANAGRIRIIADGVVVVNNGTAATGPTFTTLRPAVELVGLTIYSKTATQPAVLARCDKNTGWGGEINNGFGAGFKMVDCHLKDVGVGDSPNAGSIGLKLEGVLYPEFEGCIFEGFESGVYQIGAPSVSYGIRPVYKNCRWEGNTNDIVSASTQFARVINPVFADDGATKHIVHVAGALDDSDCLVIGGYVNDNDLAKLIPNTGWAAAGVNLATSSTMIGDADLSS
jgi:hypothetical protein